MEVGIRQGVCNNSPAEWTSPENGWRSSEPPILGRRNEEDSDANAMRRRVGGRGDACGPGSWAVNSRSMNRVPSDRIAAKRQTVKSRGAVPGADLGGSSKYSNGNFED